MHFSINLLLKSNLSIKQKRSCFSFAWIGAAKNCINAKRRRLNSTIHHPSMLSCSLLLQLFHWSGKSQEFLQAAVRVHYGNELLPNELELMWRASTSGPQNHGGREASVAVWELAVFQHVCQRPGGTRAYKCHLCARPDVWQTWEGFYALPVKMSELGCKSTISCLLPIEFYL